MVGHSTCKRTFIQCSRNQKDGKLDNKAYKVLLLTILMSKPGCSKLLHTFSFIHGGLSQHQIQRHINQVGKIPRIKLRITSCINDQGLNGLVKNMVDFFANKDFAAFLTKEQCLATLLTDGVAVDEGTALDNSKLPHQLPGLFRHCTDANFADYDDAVRFEDGRSKGDFYFATEVEVFCICSNHVTCTALLSICISPTCKKNGLIQEFNTDTVKELFRTIKDQCMCMGLNATK